MVPNQPLLPALLIYALPGLSQFLRHLHRNNRIKLHKEAPQYIDQIEKDLKSKQETDRTGPLLSSRWSPCLNCDTSSMTYRSEWILNALTVAASQLAGHLEDIYTRMTASWLPSQSSSARRTSATAGHQWSGREKF